MAKSEYYTILTKIGIAKFIAARASGNGVNLKSFKLSSKVILPSEEMQSLEEIVYEANISSKSVDEKNPNYVNLMCHVPSNVGGFEVNAIGIYDEVGDLLAVGNTPRTYKPLLEQGSAKELMLKIVMELSNADEVILKLDPSVIMASRDYVDAIKLELELKIEALANGKEDKGVAASLDERLKTELMALINKKENTGVAKDLVDALRKEMQTSSGKLSTKSGTITATYTGNALYGFNLQNTTGYPSGVSEAVFKSKCAGYISPMQKLEARKYDFTGTATSKYYAIYENDKFSCAWAHTNFSYPLSSSGGSSNNNY